MIQTSIRKSPIHFPVYEKYLYNEKWRVKAHRVLHTSYRLAHWNWLHLISSQSLNNTELFPLESKINPCGRGWGMEPCLLQEWSKRFLIQVLMKFSFPSHSVHLMVTMSESVLYGIKWTMVGLTITKGTWWWIRKLAKVPKARADRSRVTWQSKLWRETTEGKGSSQAVRHEMDVETLKLENQRIPKADLTTDTKV